MCLWYYSLIKNDDNSQSQRETFDFNEEFESRSNVLIKIKEIDIKAYKEIKGNAIQYLNALEIKVINNSNNNDVKQ